MDAGAKTIEIEMAWECPKCGGKMHMHDRERRHLDSFETFLVTNVPKGYASSARPRHGEGART